MSMSELELKRIEQRSLKLLEDLNPYLAREELWVIAAAIARMMDVAPKLEPLVKGAILSREAGREAAERADVTTPKYNMLLTNILPPKTEA